MRKRQTFLITVLETENTDTSFCGRLKVISSGKTCLFTNLEELNGLIAAEMDEEQARNMNCSFQDQLMLNSDSTK